MVKLSLPGLPSKTNCQACGFFEEEKAYVKLKTKITAHSAKLERSKTRVVSGFSMIRSKPRYPEL